MKIKERENIFTKRTLAMYLILLFFASLCNGQTSNKNNDKIYILGDYQINPAKKQVGRYTMIGGVTWDGFEYRPDERINYDSTTLFFLGNHFFFKEDIQLFPELDLNTFRIIRSELNRDESGDRHRLLARDKNYLYKGLPTKNVFGNYDTINISDYEIINDYIYKKNGELYSISGEVRWIDRDFKLRKVEGVTLDESTLTHIMGNFFADKNGLYLLYEKSVQLEESNGKMITPIIKRNYFIYGDKVYSGSRVALPLNANKIKELDVSESEYYIRYPVSFLADDDNTCATGCSECQYTVLKFGKEHYNWESDDNFFKENVNLWQIISPSSGIKFIIDDDGKTYYLPSAVKRFVGSIREPVLVKTPNGFYTFSTRGRFLQKINQVFIFNFDTQEYEELDVSQYRYLSRTFKIYKNRLYGTDGYTVEESVDVENLHFITLRNVKTNYLTDGKSLIYTRSGSTRTRGKDGKTMQVLGEQIISGVDFPTLKVVTADVLIDKNNIYNGKYDGIGVIPIKALGLDVKIFTE